MDNLEKILFIDLTCKQFGRNTHPELLSTLKLLNQAEKNEYSLLHNEIHEIWNYINSPNISGIKNTSINSAIEYNDQIHKISPKLLTICMEYNITLKRDLSEDFKNVVIKFLGKDFLDKLEK